MHRARRHDRLAAVQMSECDVVGTGREHGGRDRVRLDRVRVALATAQRAADHGQVRRDDVDGVAAGVGGERLDQASDMVRVRLVRLGRGQLEHLGRPDRESLGQERQRDHAPCFATGRDTGDDVVGGPLAYGAAQRYPGRIGPDPQRVQGRAVVVVAADRDHVGAGGPQRGQRPSDDSRRVRRRCAGVEQVTRDDHEVGLLGPGDRDDIGEDRDVLVGPGRTLEDLPDVPVGRMQDLHCCSSNA